MRSEVKRFELGYDRYQRCKAEMQEAADGDYVRHADIAPILARVKAMEDATIAALQARVEELEDAVTRYGEPHDLDQECKMLIMRVGELEDALRIIAGTPPWSGSVDKEQVALNALAGKG